MPLPTMPPRLLQSTFASQIHICPTSVRVPTVNADSVSTQKIIMMNAIVVKTCFRMSKMSKPIPLTPRLRIQLNFIIIRIIFLNLSPIDNIVLEPYASKTWLRYVLETPAAHSNQHRKVKKGRGVAHLRTTLFPVLISALAFTTTSGVRRLRVPTSSRMPSLSKRPHAVP